MIFCLLAPQKEDIKFDDFAEELSLLSIKYGLEFHTMVDESGLLAILASQLQEIQPQSNKRDVTAKARS